MIELVSMSMSLKDQLLKAGLVNEKQVKQTTKQKQKEVRLAHKGQLQKDTSQLEAIKKAQAEKIANDQLLNQQQEARKRKKAIAAEIKQLIISNRLPRLDTEDYYNFIDHKKVKRIAVNDLLRDKLTKGLLAIVSHEGYYEVVPKNIALKIKERNAQRVIVLNQLAESNDEDDPYKNFIVPDDLMW